MKTNELDTPVLVVDRDILDDNIKRMAAIAQDAGISLRPHIKTHKCPAIAHMQLKAGASGITCAKLGEAEVMAQEGINDILVAYPVWGRSKTERLINLHRKISIHISLDSIEVAHALSEAFAAVDRTLDILVEVEIGLGRLGIPIGQPLIIFVRELTDLPGIAFRGLLCHAGHVHGVKNPEDVARVGYDEGEQMVKAAEELRQAGFEVRDISVGATPTVPFSAKIPGVTEIRPGTYAFNDIHMVDIGAATHQQCALKVIGTVISTPCMDRIILDCGGKSLSVDATRNGGFGLLSEHSDIRVTKLYEEHGIIHLDRSKYPYKIGDRIEVIPNHACMCVNQWDEIAMVRNGEVETFLPVLGRGKVR